MNQERILELHRRTGITTKARYEACNRLELHHRLSQWSVALLSCALIFIPMIQVFGVPANLSPQLANLIQTILAVFVLVYSLLLSQENFILKADRMHRCGVELGHFEREIDGLEIGHEITNNEYTDLVDKYYGILEKYENHKVVDHQTVKLQRDCKTYKEKLTYLKELIFVYIKKALIFSHYIVAILGSFSIIVYLLYGAIIR